MRLDAFLSPADTRRADRALAGLRRHDVSSLVLTGGLAVELHLELLRGPAEARRLNDIDLLVDSFSEIPATLSADFLLRHVHPGDPPGKTLLQCVDPQSAVRVDLFRACGGEISRAQAIEVNGKVLRVVALEDLVARSARLCLDLAGEIPVPAKHTRDFVRMLPLVFPGAVEAVWPEHRKPDHPGTFAEVAALLSDLIPLRKDLQIDPLFSQDADATCPRCRPTPEFPLADPHRILRMLGYC
jgi:hypothetical protein